MNFKESIELYEKWLSEKTVLLKDDLVLKHKKTNVSPFLFFRATFFRWAQQWKEVPSELRDAPVVLSVGDLHIENFGTWRDQEGRLVWGINDFDEAYPLPFTNDLLRLCVSTYLAIDENNLSISKKSASKAILKGYYEGIIGSGNPFVLEEQHTWLRKIALSKLKEPYRFWDRLEELPDLSQMISKQIVDLLKSTLPENLTKFRIAHRITGLGSLGHQRYIIIGDWRGSKIGREAKVIIPSAFIWAQKINENQYFYNEILEKAIRCPDPFLKVNKNWLLRRISPHCSRIELFMLPKRRDEKKLLYAMGFETANIHLGTRGKSDKIVKSLEKLPKKWLHKTSLEVVDKVIEDWKENQSEAL